MSLVKNVSSDRLTKALNDHDVLKKLSDGDVRYLSGLLAQGVSGPFKAQLFLVRKKVPKVRALAVLTDIGFSRSSILEDAGNKKKFRRTIFDTKRYVSPFS